MKIVIAMIQPHKLPDVKKALFDADIHKMTVTNVLGCGQQNSPPIHMNLLIYCFRLIMYKYHHYSQNLLIKVGMFKIMYILVSQDEGYK